jgi:predicted transcriptional regulator
VRGQPVDFIPGELWKPIPHRDSNAQFYASSFGRIKKVYPDKRNNVQEYLIRPQTNGNGLLKVSLSLSANLADRAATYLGRLVLMAFQPCDKMLTLDFINIDGNPNNNNIDNLQWVSRKEYLAHLNKLSRGNWISGSPYIQASSGETKIRYTKIPVSTIRNIIKDNEAGLLQKEIALKYGLSQPHVSMTLAGKRRNAITEILPDKRSKHIKRTERLINDDPQVMVNKDLEIHDKKRNT